MEINKYQALANRTINKELTNTQLEHHALHGIAGEVGEIHSLYQKIYQGHDFDIEHLKKEMGDLMWFVAELCTALDVSMEVICEMNIEKLMERYPEGFDTNRSLHRTSDDI